MSSEKLGHNNNVLKGDLGGGFNILTGSTGEQTDLGIARRFGGASAAYSLRDIGAMNGRVVKVRRDVDGQGSDPEEDFSANQVQSGALEDWVNGKLETTLPADVATAAAAYSLRKVKADYSGDAVRIRRSSDDIEVDVAFDSDGKVSASSAITNVAEEGGESGSTTATDLNEFLNANEQTVGSSQNGTGSIAYNTFTGDSNTGFTVTNSDAGTFKQAVFGYESGEGDVIVANFDLNITSGTPTIQVRTGAAIGTLTAKSDDATVSSSTNHTITLTCTGDGLYIKFLESDACTFSVSNFTIVSHTHQATVHTWYDQAGSNDAVQATAANQPKIAENGALLADGLKFNGSSDNFTITNGVSGRSIFAVTNQNIDTTGGGLTGYGQDGISSLLGTAGTNSYIFISNNNSAFNSYAISIDGASTGDTGQYASNGKALSSTGGNLGTYGDIPSDTNSLLSIIYSSGDPAFDWTRLGTGINGNIFMQGSMSEVILYTTDQSDNRFKIESNINNYYGLYNDENEMAEPWNSPNASVTNESKDGFTVTNPASGDYAFFELAVPAPLGTPSVFRVSFNADDPDDALNNISVRRTENGVSGSTKTITNGFNSLNVNNNAGGTAIGLQITFNAGTKTATLSDFKVSRIPRNGFVETWYDQSGNGIDATQASAGQQPAIVQNGGICKSNGSPSLRFDGSNDELDFTDLTLTDATVFNVINFDTSKSSGIVLGGSSAAGSGGAMIPFMLNSSSTSVYVNASAGSQFVNGTSTTFGTRLEARTALRTGSQLLYTIVDLDVAEADTLDGIGRTPSDQTSHRPLAHYNEVIIYNSDLSSDRGTIESDIANHYNITLS